MKEFQISNGPLDGLVIIQERNDVPDEREIRQTYNKTILDKLGFDVEFIQENQSLSHKGVIRGVHSQKLYPQGKLIRVTSGKIFDVAVDLRKNSETYKQWFGIELSAVNRTQFYIPGGFAHGFLALDENSVVVFKVTDYFHPGDEVGFIWNDPDIQIEWPISKIVNKNGTHYTTLDGVPIILGTKDAILPFAKDVFEF